MKKDRTKASTKINWEPDTEINHVMQSESITIESILTNAMLKFLIGYKT